MRLGPDTVTVKRAPLAEDSFGNENRDWTSATSTAVGGCSVQPLPANEVIVGRDTVVSRWTLFAPVATDLEATDRVVWEGDTYEVDGEPQRWTGVYLSALLRRSQSS
jgi:hypothetical protein